MSSIKVEVTRIQDVRPHSNADALELATVGGWQMCVLKGQYHDGDPVVYFEQGTTLPPEMAERLGVAQYMKNRTDINGDPALVIHRVRLRGEPSFGLVIAPEPGMKVGQDVADYYGAEKYLPPIRTEAGDKAPTDPRFPTYTEIENMRSYPDIFVDGEEIVLTEKIHGTNCRVGFVTDLDESGAEERVLMAGSRGLRRQRPTDEEAMHLNTYWYPHTLSSVTNLLQALWDEGIRQAILFGEVYGRGIQSYNYGERAIAFRAFDLMVNGHYPDHDDFIAYCEAHNVETVPVLYRGPFTLATVREHADGPSLIGGKQGHEGVVARPLTERTDPKIGRVILKYVGDHYLFGKAAEQDTTDL